MCLIYKMHLQYVAILKSTSSGMYSTVPYPIIIFDVGISSLVNNAFSCALIVLSGCNVQGSSLMERIFIANEID